MTHEDEPQSASLAFVLFLVFIASVLLRLTSRLPVLGAVRFDLVLAASTEA